MLCGYEPEKKEESRKEESRLGRANWSNFDGRCVALIEYLCDSGSVRTIISETAFEKIKERSPGKVLEQYKGKALKSAKKNLNILGQVRVNLCKIPDKIELMNMIAIVVEGLQGHECLLGRNWQHRIPQLRTTLSKTSTIVQKMSSRSFNSKRDKSEAKRERRCCREW